MEPILAGNSVYIIKTGKNLHKIGKTQDLQKRLASYHTHLPTIFRVIRQYQVDNMGGLEEQLHILFQHKRVKGEWFELNKDDLIICDNAARNYALHNPVKPGKKYSQIQFSDEPLLQVMEANEKYLKDYSKIADDIQLGMSTNEIFELYEGTVSKTIINTVRRLLEYRTPNSELLIKWPAVVNDLSAGMSEQKILEKYKGQISQTTVQIIKRILRNQLY